MEEYKVEELKEGGDYPPWAERIEEVINDRTKEGRSLFQISTGGAGAQDTTITWVYLVFKRNV